MRHEADDLEWTLEAFHPWVPLLGRGMETGARPVSLIGVIPARVPGSVHGDLYRAGLIENPYRDQASIHCEWIENRWWMYRTTIQSPVKRSRIENGRLELVFPGLDCDADIYADGKCVASSGNMFVPVCIDLTDCLLHQDSVELAVLFRGVPDEMGQIGKTSLTRTQKARFNYKWDFSTRLINIGIWKPPYWQERRAAALEQIHSQTDYDSVSGQGTISISANMQFNGEKPSDAAAEVRVVQPDGRRNSYPLSISRSGQVYGQIVLPDARPWFPHNMGEQPLYELQISLFAGGERVDRQIVNTGIRRLRYQRNPGSPADALPYTFLINGQPVYVKGVNMTPLDHLYGEVDQVQYRRLLYTARHLNINLVRVWGGGIIETPSFYDLCDQLGILVWQEFIQSSSGIDNIPATSPSFMQLLADSATAALIEKRNHVSLVCWSGGNELMAAENQPVDLNHPNIAMLHEKVKELDPERLFLPTSASGPVEFVTTEKGVSHDVHGHWKYLGNPQHYAFYCQCDHLFHSEFGADGMTNKTALERLLSDPDPGSVLAGNPVMWIHRAEWWDTRERDRALFGSLPEETARLCLSSQWVQAEAIRFILEANRRRQPEQSGSIIWQLNEPWPNISCTNLVDYYGDCKIAASWVRQAYRSTHVSLEYKRLEYTPGGCFEADLYISTDEPVKEKTLSAVLYSGKGKILDQVFFQAVSCAAHTSCRVGQVRFTVPDQPDCLFFIAVGFSDSAEVKPAGATTPLSVSSRQVYIFSTDDTYPLRPALSMTKPVLAVSVDKLYRLPHEHWRISCTVSNPDASPALLVHIAEKTGHYVTLPDLNAFCLFPDEAVCINLTLLPRRPCGLQTYGLKQGTPGPEPVIDWHSF